MHAVIDYIAFLVVAVILLWLLYLIKHSGDSLRNEIKVLTEKFDTVEKDNFRFEKLIREEFSSSRIEHSKSSKESREEFSKSFKEFGEFTLKRMSEIAGMQKNQLETFSNQLSHLTSMNEEKFNNISTVIQSRLDAMMDGNEKKLEQMRMTVDQKLEKTLTERIGFSFKMVSERLEQVYKGLGEMQRLANGVGDLKRVLSNVKTRGVMGEYQLANILEQILTPAQYEKNVATKKESRAFVEYAVKLPGKDDGDVVWLPIDSKFQIEIYQRLLDAYEEADKIKIENFRNQLSRDIKLFAKEIQDKYIDPPNTTDFSIMFLPIEGLYAEILRNTGLFEVLQTKYRVIVAGPTTISAILSSLQMGFRTLSIEKRSSNVWKILSGVKAEFDKFGLILQKTQKKLQEASNTINDAEIRSRAISRKLRNVEEIPDLTKETEKIAD
ncbi:MAG: DNA recombination protein RmuC [Epsilonproteobacteria bacterium]|nr:DNA recombination protein RmuC [Campylobacterota bacterium]